ncbi:hypothetical protein [Streptomyces sp. NPDC006527]|uniref:hypothetical protein n=1 Tax=Streptomyces sp. NPDC006527 TaxID=3364749 RepID=UPI0036B5F786
MRTLARTLTISGSRAAAVALAGLAATPAVAATTLSYDLAVGDSIVCVLTALFAVTWCLAPRHGLPAWARRRRGETRRPVAGEAVTA